MTGIFALRWPRNGRLFGSGQFEIMWPGLQHLMHSFSWIRIDFSSAVRWLGKRRLVSVVATVLFWVGPSWVLGLVELLPPQGLRACVAWIVLSTRWSFLTSWSLVRSASPITAIAYSLLSLETNSYLRSSSGSLISLVIRANSAWYLKKLQSPWYSLDNSCLAFCFLWGSS